MTASAAPEPSGYVERTPMVGRSPEELLVRGVYYEFIALTCGHRYSMPLGLYLDPTPKFKVYDGSGLQRLLRGGVRRLLLLSPIDPMLFYESVVHELESRITWGDDGCPIVSHELGSWFYCEPSLVERGSNFDIYECLEFKHLTGVSPPYTRVTGCLVELLVLYTKVKAGVLEGDYLEYARWLKWCIERASRGDVRYVSTAELILQKLREAHGES